MLIHTDLLPAATTTRPRPRTTPGRASVRPGDDSMRTHPSGVASPRAPCWTGPLHPGNILERVPRSWWTGPTTPLPEARDPDAGCPPPLRV